MHMLSVVIGYALKDIKHLKMKSKDVRYHLMHYNVKNGDYYAKKYHKSIHQYIILQMLKETGMNGGNYPDILVLSRERTRMSSQ